MIKAEEQYYIKTVEVNVCRAGKSIVHDRHFKTPEDYKYYQFQQKEIRYVIMDSYGISYLPHRIYEGAIQHECFFASGVCNITRRYARDLDKTYFKFYDDAEEVLININKFISWLRIVPTLNLKKIQIKHIMEGSEHFLRDVPDFPDPELIQALKSSLIIKKRSDLKGLKLFHQNELDLVESH